MSIVHRLAAVLAACAAGAIAPVALAQDPPAPAPAAPVAGPPAGFDDCAACHSLTKDAAASIGPNLWGIGGRKAGATDYPYTPAMKAHAATWTSETLTAFLARPMDVVPGTSMAYPGVADPAAAKAIADYLMTLHD